MVTMMIQRIPPENIRTTQDFKILRIRTLFEVTFSVTAFKGKKKLGDEPDIWSL